MNKILTRNKFWVLLTIILSLFAFILILLVVNKKKLIGKDVFNSNNIDKITTYIENESIIVEVIQHDVIKEVISSIEESKLQEQKRLNNFKPKNQLYFKNENNIMDTIYLGEDLIVINDVFYKDIDKISDKITNTIINHVENPTLIPVEISSLINESLLTDTSKVLINNVDCTEYISDIYHILSTMRLQKLPYNCIMSGGGTIEFYSEDAITQMLVFHGDKVNMNGAFYKIDEPYFEQIRDLIY